MYLVVLSESASSTEFYLPSEIRTVYSTYSAALDAVNMLPYKITPILYGEVFPYEGISFKEHLEQNGYAFCGYGKMEVDGDSYSVAVAILQMNVA